MYTTAKAKLGVSLTLDNGVVIDLHEGDIVNGLRYTVSGVEKVISGVVRVIIATTKANSMVPTECPPEPYADRYINVAALIIDSSSVYDAELTKVSIPTITGIAGVTTNGGDITVGVGGQYKSLTEVITSAESGATIKLLDGEFTEPLAITKSLKLVGSANTVLSGPITVSASADPVDEPVVIELEQVKLTGDAKLSINNASEFSMKNCVFEDHNFTAKTMPIHVKSENPVLMDISKCTFGAQNEFAYNLFELDAPLKSGSKFNDNYFDKASCSHNIISIYGVEEDAVIEINNNIAEISKNMIRFGMKGTPKCTINVNGNVYNETDSNEEWAGLFLVQPYGKATETFAGTTINVNETGMSNVGGQLYYLYAGPNDTPFTADNQPTIIVDGEVQPPVVFE